MVSLICVSRIMHSDAGGGRRGQEGNKASRHCLVPALRVAVNMIAGTVGITFRLAAAHEQVPHDDLPPVLVSDLDRLFRRT